MEHLNAALLQILPGRNLEENLRIGLEACRRWKEMGADIAELFIRGDYRRE